MIYRRRVTAARPRWQTRLFDKICLSARWKYNGRQRTFTQISAGLTGDSAPDKNRRFDGAPAQHMYVWIISQINSAYIFRCSVPTLSMLIFSPWLQHIWQLCRQGQMFLWSSSCSVRYPSPQGSRSPRNLRSLALASPWLTSAPPVVWTSSVSRNFAARSPCGRSSVLNQDRQRRRLRWNCQRTTFVNNFFVWGWRFLDVTGTMTRPFSNGNRFLRKVSPNSTLLFSPRANFSFCDWGKLIFNPTRQQG